LKRSSDFNVNNNPDDLAGLEEKLATIKKCIAHAGNALNYRNQCPNKQR
jgi:hypothetical protein